MDMWEAGKGGGVHECLVVGLLRFNFLKPLGAK
jgi:hypothetical protein